MATILVGMISSCLKPSGKPQPGPDAAGPQEAPAEPTAPEVTPVSEPSAPTQTTPAVPSPTEELALVPTDVQFKSARILAQELSRGLGIPVQELCVEFETESCLGSVHKVALLGVEPFLSDSYSAFRDTQDATAAAVDRVGLSACAERARRDIAGADDGVFSTLILKSGGIENLQSPSTAATIDNLFKNLLRRPPTKAETSILLDLYAEVLASGSTAPAQDWATLSCFSVATSTEFLFY